jgi:hypothetical protein
MLCATLHWCPDFAALIAHDRKQWATVIHERNIKIEN